MASAVEMTSAVEEVTQLVLRERQCRDRGWWEEMTDCFAADSVVDMSWFTGSGPEFVRESKRMAGGGWGGHSVHRLSPPAVRVEGDRALAELPLAIEFRIGIGGTKADLTSYARSQYRAQRAGGCWRIARITSIYERDTLLPAVPGTRLEVDPAEFAGYRPSYRCLAWYLGQRGLRLRPDLLGDDQPEAVARQYQADIAWLYTSLARVAPKCGKTSVSTSTTRPASCSGQPSKNSTCRSTCTRGRVSPTRGRARRAA